LNAEFEGVLAVTCSLVSKATSDFESIEIARRICAKLEQQPDYTPYVGLKM
jgi:hypothetical protein